MAGTELRRTRQRTAVTTVLNHGDDFVSAGELHARLISAGFTVGLTTVYRTLRYLERAGRVDVIRGEHGGRLYRSRPETGHRHYLVCRRCGLSRAVDTDAVELWAGRLEDSTGYADIEHTLELSGTCADCLPAPARRGHPGVSRVPGSAGPLRRP